MLTLTLCLRIFSFVVCIDGWSAAIDFQTLDEKMFCSIDLFATNLLFAYHLQKRQNWKNLYDGLAIFQASWRRYDQNMSHS